MKKFAKYILITFAALFVALNLIGFGAIQGEKKAEEEIMKQLTQIEEPKDVVRNT